MLMVSGLFAYIVKYSKREQLLLTAFTLLSFPFYYFSLDLPKTIVNDAINGSEFPVDLGFDIAGFSVNFGSLPQIPYLLVLCLAFLALVVINGGFKYFINVYRGVMGERMLRRMRFQLIERVMQFPLARFRTTSQGEVVSMINQETEPLAAFIGESFSLPLYQGGMMLTILIFMFIQDWKLGVAAIALYPLQGWLIPKLQKQVNLLNRQRTVRIRKLAENLAETVAGINEIHANDNSTFYKAKYSQQLGGIYYTRIQIFKKKLFIKFLNSFIGQITPFFFFLVGGLMVIKGELSFGALIAVLAAYKDLSPPWKELLGWYQRQADTRMKYTFLMEQFDTEIAFENNDAQHNQHEWLEQNSALPIVARNVSWAPAGGSFEVDGASLTLHPGEWASIIGSGSSGKSTLAHMFARLVKPTSGRILVGEEDAAQIPETVTGQAVGYVGHDSYLNSTSVRENILISLKNRPQSVATNSTGEQTPGTPQSTLEEAESLQIESWLVEARLSGNSEIDPNAEWIDFERAGAADSTELSQRLYAVLRTVDLEDDLVRFALASTIDPIAQPELVKQIMLARDLFRERVATQGLDAIVESFDPDQYNDNSTVADNILFGAANDDEFSADGLSEHPMIRALLKEHDLADALDSAAISTAATMVELFSDLAPGHEFFERYSFVDADDLPVLKRILGLIEHQTDINDLADEDRKLLRSLPYRVIVGRHRLGLFEEDEKEKILRVRKSFAAALNSETRRQIDLFSPDNYNASSTIGENIIFGRVIFGRLGAADKVHKLIIDVLQSLQLLPRVIDVGLAAPSGLAGSRLPVSQQQKLALARALIKQPKVLIVNEGLSALDIDGTSHILTTVRNLYPKMSLLWVDNQLRFQTLFDRAVFLETGKVTKVVDLSKETDEPDTIAEEEVDQVVRSSDSVEEDEKITLIKSIPMFLNLDDAGVRLLASTSEAIDIPKGSRLFNQGDPGDALYIVIDGKAGILLTHGEWEKQMQECGPGEVIGELALFSNATRSASVKATTDLTILRLKREVFIELLRSNGEIGYQILQVVANRFVDSSRKLEKEIQSHSTAPSSN